MLKSTKMRHLSSLTRTFTFITRLSFNHSNTCTYVRLLGPCFQTGWLKSFKSLSPHCESQKGLKQCCTSVYIRSRKLDIRTEAQVKSNNAITRYKPTKTSIRFNATPKKQKESNNNTNFNHFPFNDFRFFSLSFQNSFNLSFTVLVRYRSLASI
jgi:hypothetical protein